MPIETSQHLLALRSKKNAQVAHNLARLWDIAKNSSSDEELLAQLHPWGESPCLRFDNGLAIFIALVAGLLLLPLLLQPTAIWAQLLALGAAALLFLSYLLYAPKRPINEAIEALEHSIIQKRYALNYHSLPSALGRPLSTSLLMSQLKQQFPIFSRGSVSNDIPFFASSVWQEADGKTHQVLIFQYHYVNELRLPSKDGQTQSKEIHQDLWGVFIFDLDHDLPTFAVSTEHKKLAYPYHLEWQSSDIQLRQRVYMGGENPLEMAKKITPSFTLKLGEFFAQRRGEVYINANQNMLCYLGRDDLMQIQQQRHKKIDDISALRGHLRTFRLPKLERLKQQLLVLLA